MRCHACVGLAGVAAAVVLACGEDLGPRIPAAIVLTPEAPKVPVAGTLQLAATVVDEAGEEIPGQTVTFQSSDTTAITVSGAGLLTSVAWIDSALITATSGDLTAQVQAEVVLPPSALVPRVRVLELDTGEQRLLGFHVTDENGDSVWGAEVAFESSNPAVAHVRALNETQAPLVTALWIVDGDDQSVEIWTPADEFPAVERERLVWHPAGARQPYWARTWPMSWSTGSTLWT